MGSLHLHNFRIVNRSQSHYGTGIRWVERCRCSCTIQCDNTFDLGNISKAKTVKRWFDREGNLIRVTGEFKGYRSSIGEARGELTSKTSMDNSNSQAPIDNIDGNNSNITG